MAALLSIFFLTLVLSTHHAVGGKQEKLCSKFEEKVEKYCPKKESGPKLPLPCPSYNWNCEGDIIQTLYNVTSWEDCGRACDNYHIDGCDYWTYTYYNPAIGPMSIPVCSLQSSCPLRRSDVSTTTSGAWNCPEHNIRRADTLGLGLSCGNCPYCLGACFLGICGGACISMAKTGASLEEACLYQGNSLYMNECSGNCSVAGEPACQTCISDNGAEECAWYKSFGCSSCLYDVGKALYYCLTPGLLSYSRIGSPEFRLTCIIERIPDSCASCACELACKLHHPICQLC